ncbi:MAG: YfcE family phosphodiesterase [Candidatus Altiarchaeota archaeon]|nr:YfcE family phosphodiesterase [Candidatus Altiarchaeota archaeon]
MKILALADVHGDTDKLYKLVSKLDKPDAVLIAGDLTNSGPAETVDKIKEILESLTDKIMAVPGNWDDDESRKRIKELGIDIHNSSVELGELKIIGFEGAQWVDTDSGVFMKYDPVHNKLFSEKKIILLTHVPPFDTRADTVWSGHHVGSPFLRTLVEEYQPALLVCGHIHEGLGLDKIGKTVVLNPGAVCDGYAAWIDWSAKPKISLLKLKGKKLEKIELDELILPES